MSRPEMYSGPNVAYPNYPTTSGNPGGRW
jgi:hypothetical protein